VKPVTYLVKAKEFSEILIRKLKKDPIQDWSAQLAFFFMLSIFPFLIFILALLPYIPLQLEQVYIFIEEYVPVEIANILTTNILDIISEPKGGLLSFGVLATIWSSSNGMNALIRALNKSYNIDETRSFIRVRLLSIIMTLGMVIVFVVTLLLPVFGRLILEGIDSLFNLPMDSFELLNRLRWVIGISIMTIVLMVIYYLAPNKRIPFANVLYGAIFATLMWQLISFAFSIYIANFGNFSATYGSLGGIIILMLWFFLSGLILVVGGQINATLQNMKEEKIK
jgi:membrane protein